MSHQMKNHIGLLGAICGSLLLSVPAIAQTNPTPKPSANSASSETCAANTDASMSPAEGTSSVNSNRNTPTADRASNNDRDNDRDNDTDSDTDNNTDSRTTQGSSSANSDRNTPTAETSGTESAQASTGSDATAMSDRNNTSTSAETCAVPSSSSPDRDKQMQPRTTRRVAPPTPEQRQAASAMVRPANGTVNIKLINETGANIVYEAIGETNQRNLQGQTTITLQRLDTPSTLTFFRTDGGLLRVNPQPVAPGVLEVRFAATTDLGIDKNSLTVQPSGAVYVN